MNSIQSDNVLTSAQPARLYFSIKQVGLPPTPPKNIHEQENEGVNVNSSTYSIYKNVCTHSECRDCKALSVCLQVAFPLSLTLEQVWSAKMPYKRGGQIAKVFAGSVPQRWPVDSSGT